MKKIALISLVLIEALVFGFQQKVSGQNSVREYQVNSPVARDSSIVKVGKARFTILTSQLVRMEWDSSGLFEDKASLVFLNRNLSVPYFKKEINSHDLTITTNKLQLNYKIDSGKFSPENLSIKFNLNGNEVTWYPGIDDSLNLKGTTRTLDGWFGGSLENLEDGLISRSGWALVDDSRTNLFDGNPDWNWVVERPEGSRQDWYFFGYGHEYKKCLKDFTKVALNLHPASGIAPMEEKYSEFAEAFNFDTTDRKNIPFQMENKKFAKTYFNLLLKPFEKLGVDFWWIDWQQWPYTKTIENLSNTWWLNYTFYTNMERNGRRALLFHRWGGLGNHRYQIGFSGDVVVSWQSLTFQPGFTATASNVCYGYWSHDIGGHIPMSIPTDPELYLRWLQYGAFSPILRTHVTKSRISERRIWMFPGYSDLMKSAIELRYALVPYIYNYARKAYDTGISICRPMYYEYPEREIAYQYMNQYYFGDDMIIAPVADPVDKKTNISMKEIWLPEGEWFEWTSGTILEGGKVITRKYALNDKPVFVKAGSIIPMYPKVNNLDSVGDKIILNIIPGISSEIFIYDDDGISDGYKENEFTRIKAAVNYKDDKTLLVSISPRTGSYKNMPDKISYEIRITNTLPPESVMLNNTSIKYSQEIEEATWSFNGDNLETYILLQYSSLNEEIILSVVFPKSFAGMNKLTAGVKGNFKRLSQTVSRFKRAAGGEHFLPDWLYSLENTPTRITYNPLIAENELVNFSSEYNTLTDKLNHVDIGNKELISNSLSGLFYSLSEEESLRESEYKAQLNELEKLIKYDFPYADEYFAKGNTVLFDGKHAEKVFRDPNWQGFEGNDLSVTIDLKDKIPINNIGLKFLKYHLLGMFSPVYVEFYFSNDGINFENKGIIENKSQTSYDETVAIEKFEKNFGHESARYIKVVAKNMGIRPEWHHEAGEKAWLLVDEIDIN